MTDDRKREPGELFFYPIGDTRLSLRATAVHEAAHACAQRIFDEPIKSATIVPEGDIAGCVTSMTPLRALETDDEIEVLRWKARAERHVVILLVGEIAQRKFNAAETQEIHSSHDWRDAVDIADAIFDQTASSPSPREVVDAYLRYCLASAEALVDTYWPQILAVADALEAEGAIDDERLAEVWIASSRATLRA